MLRLHDQQIERLIVAQTIDLSPAGLALSCEEAPPLGEPLVVALIVEDCAVALPGRIVNRRHRTHDWRLGVRFESPSPDQQTALTRCVLRALAIEQERRREQALATRPQLHGPCRTKVRAT